MQDCLYVCVFAEATLLTPDWIEAGKEGEPGYTRTTLNSIALWCSPSSCAGPCSMENT